MKAGRVRVWVLAGVVVVVGLSFMVLARIRSHRGGPRPLTLYGNVDIRQVELAFRVPGRVLKMNFDDGQEPAAGAVLAELDPQTYEEEVRSSEAQVSQQAALLARLERGPRPAEIAQGRALLAGRRAEATNARLAFRRAQELFPQHAITRAAFDDASTARNLSEAHVAEAEEALRLLLQGTRAEDIAAGRANLEAARAHLASARTALADTRLLAPSRGVILSRVREPGAIVSPSEPVYVLSLPQPIYVRAYVAEPELGRVQPGAEVSITSDTAPRQERRGHVGFISPVAEFTPKSVQTPELRTDLVYRLRVVVDEPDEALRQGMPVTVRVQPTRTAEAE